MRVDKFDGVPPRIPAGSQKAQPSNPVFSAEESRLNPHSQRKPVEMNPDPIPMLQAQRPRALMLPHAGAKYNIAVQAHAKQKRTGAESQRKESKSLELDRDSRVIWCRTGSRVSCFGWKYSVHNSPRLDAKLVFMLT